MRGLQLSGVSRAFGGHRVLHDVDLSVGRGEIVGFIGGNGAGKTTTMRLILGLLTPDTGTITWDGAPITAEDRRSIGYMPEERGLYPQMRVREQVIHFALLEGHDARGARETAEEVIDALGLAERADTLVQDLSLGNQQRVQLAVSLVGDPSLLVLDEPFSGLDPVAVETMAGLIRQQSARGVGVLFSSHQLDLVERLCDTVCVLDSGRVTASGAVAELQDDGRSRWQLQFSRPLDDLLVAELGVIPGLSAEPVPGEPESLLVSIEGSGRDVPEQVLATLTRHGGLRSIRTAQRSLTELLSERLTAASTPAAERRLEIQGAGR
ncbi:ABC transporter ATP-binding protein [Rathayibacter sp. AY1C6]|nr:ABC transporter ATP-binding protein [Rathayibacter sp. AY1C6]